MTKALWTTPVIVLSLFILSSCAKYDVKNRCCENEYEVTSQNYRVPDTFSLHIPQAFTPNGDGINDQFRPIGIGWTVEVMKIKRGLKTVYENDPHLEPYWDGGDERDGRYKYFFTFRTSVGDLFDVEGDVCVMRYGAVGERLPEVEEEKICDCVTADMIDSLAGASGQTLECAVIEGD